MNYDSEEKYSEILLYPEDDGMGIERAGIPKVGLQIR